VSRSAPSPAASFLSYMATRTFTADKPFRKELLKGMRSRTGPKHAGEERRETEQAWAEQLLADELNRHRWTDADLAQRRKGDAQKLKIAQRLRRNTTMTLNWIAKRLSMGAASSLANLLRKAT